MQTKQDHFINRHIAVRCFNGEWCFLDSYQPTHVSARQSRARMMTRARTYKLIKPAIGCIGWEKPIL